jgi:glycosyltransferase involved in cell wall biosynthesis
MMTASPEPWATTARNSMSPSATFAGNKSALLQTRPTVCQVLHGLWIGGAEVLAARLARNLADTYRFVFVCLDKLGSLGRQLREEGFPVHVLNRSPGFDWNCSRRLADLLRRERVNVVHAHQYTPFFYAMVARLLYRRPPVLFTEHGRHQPDYPRRKRIFANRLLLKRRDRVVGVGEAVRQALIRNEGIPAERVEVIYNGINLAPIVNGTPNRDALRQEIGVGARDLVILQVARLDYLKDHATAIRALGHVVQSRPEAKLVLVGEGPELSSIQEVVHRHGLESHVLFLGLRTDVARLLRAADVFLLTSISEGIPLTVIEAMASGLPVVATRVGGLAEVVEEGHTGLLAAAGDDRGLAQHLLHLACNPALGEQMGKSGKARAHQAFTEDQMHGQYVQLYRAMLRE